MAKYSFCGEPIDEEEIRMSVEMLVAGGMVESMPKTLDEMIDALEELGYEIEVTDG